jgi:uncharacterized membrane protein
MDHNLPLDDRLRAAGFLPSMSFGFVLVFGVVGSAGFADFGAHLRTLNAQQWSVLAVLFLLLSALGFYLGTFRAFRIHSYGAGSEIAPSGPIGMGMARIIFFGATLLAVIVFMSGKVAS